jgi:hypothetical protein
MRWKNLTLICATGLLATSAWADDRHCLNCSTSSNTSASGAVTSSEDDMFIDEGQAGVVGSDHQ